VKSEKGFERSWRGLGEKLERLVGFGEQQVG
jgi:hypothetical protein